MRRLLNGLVRTRNRRLGTAFVVALAAAGGVSGWLIRDDLLLALPLALVVGGLAAIGVLVIAAVRQVQRTTVVMHKAQQRIDRRIVDHLTEHDETTTVLIERHLTEHDSATRALHQRLEQAQQQLERSVVKQAASTNTTVAKAKTYLTQISSRHSRETFRQLEALTALYVDTATTVGFPATRGWNASPDTLHYLHGLVGELEPRLIVECGSGVSTVVMAYALRARGEGRVVALEHLEGYADATRRLLTRHDLTGWAGVRFAPLTPVVIDDETWPWYSLDAVPEGPIDLLFVDGPPGTTREHARYPAVPLLIETLSPQGVIVLDDYVRNDEQELVDRWMQKFPTLVREILPHEKGTAVFRIE